jgi:NADPH:quinone reductase-like Zn-dependent oxidoreductase
MSASEKDQSLPKTARALIFKSDTKALALKPSYLLPVPDPHKNDHLIKVQTTALCARELIWPINFPDAMFAENPSRLIIPGYDLAGTVISSPPGSPFKPGYEIFARTRPSRQGNCRDYTIVRTEEMALKPKGMDWVDAASVPLSAETAWQMLFEKAGVSGMNDPAWTGKKVLINAAAGAVGGWAVQFAKLAGLHVIAQIGSAENDKFVKELGADETLNYRTTSLKEWAAENGRVDIVLDVLGGNTLQECWYCVKDGGALISIFEPPDGQRPEGLDARDVKNLFFIMEPNGEQLAEISKLLEHGKCRPNVDSVWSLEEYEKAFERSDGGHAKGKVVIKIAE